jgi:hypothetical protein
MALMNLFETLYATQAQRFSETGHIVLTCSNNLVTREAPLNQVDATLLLRCRMTDLQIDSKAEKFSKCNGFLRIMTHRLG